VGGSNARPHLRSPSTIKKRLYIINLSPTTAGYYLQLDTGRLLNRMARPQGRFAAEQTVPRRRERACHHLTLLGGRPAAIQIRIRACFGASVIKLASSRIPVSTAQLWRVRSPGKVRW
jgi:hypothetical protein